MFVVGLSSMTQTASQVFLWSSPTHRSTSSPSLSWQGGDGLYGVAHGGPLVLIGVQLGKGHLACSSGEGVDDGDIMRQGPHHGAQRSTSARS